MNNLCESCAKRKTMYCPNSSKCYCKKDKPYWESGLMLLQKLDAIKFYIEQSNIKDMLWGKEILKIIGGNDDSTRNV